MNRKIFEWLRVAFFFGGCSAFFVIERYYSSVSHFMALRIFVLSLLLLSVIVTLVLMRSDLRQSHKEAGRIWFLLCCWQVVFIAGLLIYIVYVKITGNAVNYETIGQKLTLGAWLLLTLLSGITGVGLEMAFMRGGRAEFSDYKKVSFTGGRWFLIAMLTCSLICINYIAVKRDKIFDLSYLKVTKPSDSARNNILNYDGYVEIIAFYPIDNEVKVYVEEYFSSLVTGLSRVNLTFVDKDLEPLLAEKYRVTKNGQVVIRLGENRQKNIEIGLDINKARLSLAKLDGRFQEAFVDLTEGEKVVYFTTGHGEMSWTDGDDPLRSLRGVEMMLKMQKITLKALSIKEGLSSEIPKDAEVVVVASPIHQLLQEEVNVLRKYFESGGNVLIMLDKVEQKHPVTDIYKKSNLLIDFLENIGVSYSDKLIVDDKNFMSATHTKTDRYFWFTNIFSSHSSVSLLAQNEDKVNLLFYRSGYFECFENKNPAYKIVETIRTGDTAFVDLNGDLNYDKGSEKRKSYTTAVAVQKIQNGSSGSNLAKTGKMLLFSDGEIFSDFLLRNAGNQLLLIDSFNWLINTAKISSTPNSEEDVPIQFSRSRDVSIFYGTTVAIPALVLIVGFFATRKRKRRKGVVND